MAWVLSAFIYQLPAMLYKRVFEVVFRSQIPNFLVILNHASLPIFGQGHYFGTGAYHTTLPGVYLVKKQRKLGSFAFNSFIRPRYHALEA